MFAILIDKNPHCCFNLHSFLVRLIPFYIFKGLACFLLSGWLVYAPFVIFYYADLYAVRILTICFLHMLYVFFKVCNLLFNVLCVSFQVDFYTVKYADLSFISTFAVRGFFLFKIINVSSCMLYF